MSIVNTSRLSGRLKKVIDFRVGEASNFIEYLLCYGAENAVPWSNKSTDIYNEYKEAQR